MKWKPFEAENMRENSFAAHIYSATSEVPAQLRGVGRLLVFLGGC
jgi:hypothetical protein